MTTPSPHSLLTALACMALALALGGCKKDSADPAANGGGEIDSATPRLQKVQLQLNWFPEAEHGGYYQAVADGLYEDAGIDVEIVPGGPATPVAQQVGAGRVAFGIANADVILMARAQGVPIVGLMAPFQKSPRCIIVKEDAPYQSLADIKNTTLVANNTKPFIAYLKDKYGLDGVQIVPYGGGRQQFLINDDYAIQGYLTSEPIVFEKEGYPVRSFPLYEDGYNPYASVLFTSEDFLRENQNLCRAMIQASQRGWLHYLDDPTKANLQITAANADMPKDVLDFGGTEQRKLMNTDEAAASNVFGIMVESRWQALHDELVRLEIIPPSDKPISDAFTTEFLQTNPE